MLATVGVATAGVATAAEVGERLTLSPDPSDPSKLSSIAPALAGVWSHCSIRRIRKKTLKTAEIVVVGPEGLERCGVRVMGRDCGGTSVRSDGDGLEKTREILPL